MSTEEDISTSTSSIIEETTEQEEPKHTIKDFVHFLHGKMDESVRQYHDYLMMREQEQERQLLKETRYEYLYPSIFDPDFNKRIASKKEFSDLVYEKSYHDPRIHSEKLCNADFELAPHQIFVRNFLSSYTPYKSLLLYHGLGTGKTCSAISICEEMRDYMKQMGITKKIIIVASPNVQENFKLQLFDSRKLQYINGRWNIRACTGNRFIHEINPMNMEGMDKSMIIKQIRNLIRQHYSFMGYEQFANEIERIQKRFMHLEEEEDDDVSEDEKMRRKEQQHRAIQQEFSERLIVIDEVHNISIEGNIEKKIANNLLQIVLHADNLRLLLLSATPMYNNYREIIWLINLMNMNDKRPPVHAHDIFDKQGNFKIINGREVGKDLFIRKIRGYVSFLRGENPYTFPYRIYPSDFNRHRSILSSSKFTYPEEQINRVSILEGIQYTDLYLNDLGDYQKDGYRMIVEQIKKRFPKQKDIDEGGMGWTLTEPVIQSLTFIYPSEKIDNYRIRRQTHKGGGKKKKGSVPSVPSTSLLLSSSSSSSETIPFILEHKKRVEKLYVKRGMIPSFYSGYYHNHIYDSNDVYQDTFYHDEKDIPFNLPTDFNYLHRYEPVSLEKEYDDFYQENKFENMDVILRLPAGLEHEPYRTPPSELRTATPTEEESEKESSPSNTLVESLQREPEDEEPDESDEEEEKDTRKEPTPSDKEESEEEDTEEEDTKKHTPSKETTEFELEETDDKDEEEIRKEPTPSDKQESEEETEEESEEEETEEESEEETEEESEEEESEDEQPDVQIREFIGRKGLQNVMNYDKTRKSNFSYKSHTIDNYGRIFSIDILKHYSAKIHRIMRIIQKSQGIVLIYSQYIDGGCVPIALALEELGFQRYQKQNLFEHSSSPLLDSRTMKPRQQNQQDFKPAQYVMITGDPRLSPNNVSEINATTNLSNVNGEDVKVIIVSKAGSEGIDFKYVRQVHILDPWYNLSREEQIIGRAVRFCSHKDLPFEQRNVEIYLHATKPIDSKETMDLYIYRMAEKKAIQIGMVSRILKENAVDCYLGTWINQIPYDKLNKTEEIETSTGKKIQYAIGDKPHTHICDFMESCEYTCSPRHKHKEYDTSWETYNENFMKMNADTIIQRIKDLFKERMVYTREEIFNRLPRFKSDSFIQKMNALNYILHEKHEYTMDMFGRMGHIINIGDYYYFHPIELMEQYRTPYEARSQPIPYRHDALSLQLTEEIQEHPLEKPTLQEKPEIVLENRIESIYKDIEEKLENALNTRRIDRGVTDWYKHAALGILELNKNLNLDFEEQKPMWKFLVFSRILDTMSEKDKIILYEHVLNEQKKGESDIIVSLTLRYLSRWMLLKNNKDKRAIMMVRDKKVGMMGVREDENNRYYLSPLESSEYREFSIRKYKLQEYNTIVGFMIHMRNQIVFKTKDIEKSRNKGARCDQSNKGRSLDILNHFISNQEDTPEYTYTTQNTRSIRIHQICAMIELMSRMYQYEKEDDKVWFLPYEYSLLNKIEDISR